MHPLVLDAVRAALGHATSFQLHLTQVIGIGPGEPGQMIHRDQWAFDFFPFPSGYEVQCNTIWAMTDFTEANGATRVIPGSHRLDDRLEFRHADSEPAEMPAGSVLFYTGALYHGGGANRSDRGALRPQHHLRAQLAAPGGEPVPGGAARVARTLPEPLLRLMGYARGAYALGYVDDLRDPLDVLLGRDTHASAFGELERAAERAREPLP